jgi:hypothetical protein
MKNKPDWAFIVVLTLLILCLFVMGYGFYRLLEIQNNFKYSKGDACEVEVQFKDSKAVFVGKIV